MEDNYVEWLVKRKDPSYAVPAKILLVVVCVLSLLFAMQSLIGIIVLAAACGASYFIFLNLSVEFEYLYADGGLRVDRILGKAKRKKVFDCEKEEVQFVAPADSYMLKDYEKQGMKIQDCSSKGRDAKVYALIYQKGADCVKVLFEPNERMLSAMKRSYPRKIVI